MNKTKLKNLLVGIKNNWPYILGSVVLAFVTCIMVFKVAFLEEEAQIIVGNELLSTYEFQQRYYLVKNQYADLGYNLDKNPTVKEHIRKSIANTMVNEEVKRLLAKENGTKVSEKEITEYLKENGITTSDFPTEVERKIARATLIVPKLVDDNLTKVNLKPEEVEGYYNRNQDKYIRPVNIYFENLIFSSEESAKAAMVDLNKGGNLETYKSKEDIQYFNASIDKSEESDFQTMLISLNHGRWSEPKAIGSEWSLYKVEKVEEKRPYEFEEVKDKVANDYLYEQIRIMNEKSLEKIYANNKINIYLPE